MLSDEEIEACAFVVATLMKKRRWGGSVVGHRSKNVTASMATFD
jgi:hypothetical protein